MGKSGWVVLVMVLTAPLAARAQNFPYAQFQRSSLTTLTDNFDANVKSDPGKPGDVYVEGPIMRQVVKADYTGQRRPVAAKTTSFIQGYEKAHALKPQSELYKEEYLFRENGRDYWLPVEDVLAAYFTKEAKTGQAMDLYLVAAGGYRGSDGWIWVLPVEEFNTGK